eukprot:s423_g1.t1
MEIMMRAGYTGDNAVNDLEALENASAIVNAYQEHLQRVCAVFLAALVKFKEQVPSSYVDQVGDELLQTLLVSITADEEKVKKAAEPLGGLDMQYLSARFEKGKEAVGDYMARRHIFRTYKSLSLAQGDIVAKQAALGKSAFGEWSIACVNKQLEVLNQNTSGPAFHYMGIFLNDDMQLMNKSSSTVTGMFVSKWWDQSSEAGPKRRPRSTFDEAVPTLEVLAVANGAAKILDSV